MHLTGLKSVVRIESYLAVEIKESQHSYEIVVDVVASVTFVAPVVVVECSVSRTQTSFAVLVESSAVAAPVTAEAAAKSEASIGYYCF